MHSQNTPLHSLHLYFCAPPRWCSLGAAERLTGSEGSAEDGQCPCVRPQRGGLCALMMSAAVTLKDEFISHLFSPLPSHLDCIRINCTTSKSRFTLIPFLLLLLLLLPPLLLLSLSLLCISVSGCSCFNVFLRVDRFTPDVAFKSTDAAKKLTSA